MSEDDFTQYGIYKAGILIWKVVPPILIMFGTVGNSLTIVVLTRKSIRASTTALFLTVLAFSDLIVLYSGLLRQWLIYLFTTDVRHVSEAGCKINMWLVYSSLDFSAWILIAVTLERVISAWFPHNAKTICTKKSAIAFLIAICGFILALNAHILYGMVYKIHFDKSGVPELKKCLEVNDAYYSFFNKVWPWIDLCAFCVIPFFVIVIGNGLILFKVLKSQRKAKSAVVPSVSAGARARSGPSGAQGKHPSMTAMLFTLNVVFLVSTSPVSIYNIGYAYWISGASPHRVAQLDFWWAVVNMFMYTNNSLNFLLYCLSGTKFRREVVKMFRSKPNAVNAEGNLGHSHTRTRFAETATPEPSRSRSASNSPNTNSARLSNISTKQNVPHANGSDKKGALPNSLHPSMALTMTKHSPETENWAGRGDGETPLAISHV
ncbi:FMRFamide receptor-like [Mya arenaria]|uniref:FMRFamide receptor-like n=1 Tax=Mya arenaria TaxID=6604 RepID=UPI0022E580E8|nr:FMRFamide receptor-like [Mya arenaria]XP_052796431.1 FMRFamide receptor-like [Mya arenaria]